MGAGRRGRSPPGWRRIFGTAGFAAQLVDRARPGRRRHRGVPRAHARAEGGGGRGARGLVFRRRRRALACPARRPRRPAGGTRARRQREDPVAAWLDHLRVERGLARTRSSPTSATCARSRPSPRERGMALLALTPADLADFVGVAAGARPLGPLAGAPRVRDPGLLRLRAAGGPARARPDRERARAARLPRRCRAT